MAEIANRNYRQLCDALLRCGPFDNDRNLKSIFIDARISPWREQLPEASSKMERVEAIIEFLHDQYNEAHDNALVLFLHVLSDRHSSGDMCHHRLAELADKLDQELVLLNDTEEMKSPDTASQNANISINTGGGDVAMDNATLIKQSGGEFIGSPIIQGTISTQQNKTGAFSEKKKQLIRQRLDALIEEYEAANNQLLQALSEVDRVRLRRTMASLETQISETEAELAAIG